MKQTKQEKAVAKAKKTRKANLLIKGKENQKYQNALKRASTAENKLKAYKEGLKDALNMLGGKI